MWDVQCLAHFLWPELLLAKWANCTLHVRLPDSQAWNQFLFFQIWLKLGKRILFDCCSNNFALWPLLRLLASAKLLSIYQMETLSTFHEPGRRWYSFPKTLSGRLRNLVWQKFITFTIYDVMNLIINKLWYVLFPFFRDWQGQTSLDLGPTKRKLLHFRNSSVSFSAWHAERNEVFTNLFKLTDHDFDNRVYWTCGIATFQTKESWIIFWR